MLRSRTIREGSVGLLILSALAIFGGVGVWLRGFNWGNNGYQIIAEFPNVKGIQVGATVRYRGLDIGEITSIKPNLNTVDVAIKVNSKDLRIPRQVDVVANRSGLIGESSIDITPLAALPKDAESLDPLGNDCKSKAILCDRDRLQGQPGITFDELLPVMARIAELYGDPKFFDSFKTVLQNTSSAAVQFSELSKELSLLSKDVRQNFKTFSGTAQAFTNLANTTSTEISNTSKQINSITTQLSNSSGKFEQTAESISKLANNVNELVTQNRTSIVTTLNTITSTSEKLSDLVVTLNTTVKGVSSQLETADTGQLIGNLQTLTANAAKASENLKDISSNLNEPKNLLVIQQTLDSARATFENVQKITADLDELTGDPNFRDNVRNLVKGLGNLLSSSQELEQQVETAKILEPFTETLEQKVRTNLALESVKTANTLYPQEKTEN